MRRRGRKVEKKNMAREPQIITAVIHPCDSPVPKAAKRQCLTKLTKSKLYGSSQQQITGMQSNSIVPLKGNFAKPAASTLLKSKCLTNVSSSKRKSKISKARAPVSLSKRKEANSSAANASAPTALQKTRKPILPETAKGRKSTTSERSQLGGTAASVTSGSARQHSSTISSRSGGTKKSTSLSSRPPHTSSVSRQSSRVSAASTQTRYPGVTTATPASSRRRSPSPSPRAPSPRLGRPASHETRLNQLKTHIDRLRQAEPRIGSPEFTSTRTNLARRTPSPGLEPTADTGPWQLSGSPAALFASQRRPASRSLSRSRSRTELRSRSRSRSRSLNGAASDVAGNRAGTDATWVETINRASALAAGPSVASAAPPTRRRLPRVCYPHPSPAMAPPARASSSQTRRTTLRSRGGQRGSLGVEVRVSSRRPVRTPANQRRPANDPSIHCRPTRTPASKRKSTRDPPSPEQPSPHRPARTPASRAVPTTIDYSPQSTYMSDLLRRGEVLRPAGKENLRPGGPAGSKAGRTPGKTGRRKSTESQRSATSEPAQSPRPSRSILRTSSSSNPAASEPAARHYGYGWVSDMLDLSAPLPKTRREVEAARRFRDNNWEATHGRTAGRDAPGDQRSPDKQRDRHKCVHEYYINSRLFPTPLYTDSEGRSQCPVCLAVGPSPDDRRRRAQGAGTRSRSPEPEPEPERFRRARSRSPEVGRSGRDRSRGGAAVGGAFRATPARRRSSVSWRDEVAPASPRAARTETSRGGRSGRTKRSRSQSGSVSVTCPKCRHNLSVSAADLSDAFSDSLEPTRGRQETRGPAPVPVPSPPPRLGTVRCPGEEGETRVSRRQSPSPTGGKRRSPVTLRSRPPRSGQPVKAMFTVPTSLFHGSKELGGRTNDGSANWDVIGSMSDLGGRLDPSTSTSHPLWPTQLDLSPSRVRPIARGWPRVEARGNLRRLVNPLKLAATGMLQSGRSPATRRSVQDRGGGAKNTYSLRRVIGERI